MIHVRSSRKNNSKKVANSNMQYMLPGPCDPAFQT